MKLPLQLDEMQAQLEHAKQEVKRVTFGLSEGQLWQPPPDGGWSVGECLAHLNIAGEGYVVRLRPALHGSQSKSPTQKRRGPFRFGLLGGLFARSLAPYAQPKLRAPRSFKPEPQEGVTERFLALQDELLELLQLADGTDLSRIVISSPVSKFLRLSVFEALNVVTVHELRHLEQAARVRATLKTV